MFSEEDLDLSPSHSPTHMLETPKPSLQAAGSLPEQQSTWGQRPEAAAP